MGAQQRLPLEDTQAVGRAAGMPSCAAASSRKSRSNASSGTLSSVTVVAPGLLNRNRLLDKNWLLNKPGWWWDWYFLMRWLSWSRSGGQNRPVNCLKTCYKVPVLNKKITKKLRKLTKGSPTRGQHWLWKLTFLCNLPSQTVTKAFVQLTRWCWPYVSWRCFQRLCFVFWLKLVTHNLGVLRGYLASPTLDGLQYIKLDWDT